MFICLMNNLLGLYLCRNKKQHPNYWTKYVGTKRHLRSFIPRPI